MPIPQAELALLPPVTRGARAPIPATSCSICANGHPFTVVGVSEKGFFLAQPAESVNFGIDGLTRRATKNVVSGNYFEVLGVRPLWGRVLSAEDERVRGGHPVAVLSHGFWVERLGSRPDIVGQTIWSERQA